MADKALEDRKKKWYLDVKSTPCARGSLINGISGGGVLGVAYYYLRGGVVRRSCDVAVAGFAIIALGSWEVCRYQKAKQRAIMKRTLDTLNKQQQQQQQPEIVRT